MAGFTLLEIMLVLVIVGVVAGIAVPNLRQFLDKTRVSTHANELVSDLNFARTESVTRGRQITVCGSADGISCAVDVTGWSVGRIIFVDADKNGSRSGSETLLRQGGAVDPKISVSSSGFPNDTYIAFLPYGGLSPSGSGAFAVCPVIPAPNAPGRQVAVVSTGRITTSAVSCS